MRRVSSSLMSMRGQSSGAALAVVFAIFWLCAGAAYAAPPVVCVRNLSSGDINVVAGVHADQAERPGVYLGTAKARGGACWYADIDGAMNVSFLRGASAAQIGEQYSTISTAGGAWRGCPAQTSASGRYIYTVRRTSGGLVCRSGGNAAGLEGPGDYE